MKVLITLLFIISINLFGYQFSDILPRNTIFYFALEDIDSVKKDLKSLPETSFYKSDDFKKIKDSVKKIASISMYNEENDLSKVDKFFNDLEKVFLNSFSFSVGLDKFLSPQYSIIIKGDNLDTVFKNAYKELLDKEIKTGKALVKKQIVNNVKVDVLTIKKANTKNPGAQKNKTKEESYTLVYASLGDKFIITSSLDYMSLLITTIKNKSIPKLSSNLVFKKDKLKYKNSSLYMFLNLKTLIKVFSVEEEFKLAVEKLSLGNLDSVIAYSLFDKKNKSYKAFLKLVASKGIPKEIKSFFKQEEIIKIPKFIPENCYSFNAFHFQLSTIYDLLVKLSNKKDLKRMTDLEKTVGISIKSFLEGFGSNFYLLNFLKAKQDSFVFIFSYAKPEFLVKLIRAIGTNSVIALSEKDYLDGKIFASSGNFKLLGYGLAYKNNKFIIGNIKVIKEIMQKMGGNSGSFYNSNFYRKIQPLNTKKQNVISVTDNATSMYLTMSDIKKSFNKDFGNASTKEMMKIVKVLKGLVNHFGSMSIESWRKYFTYSLLSFYVNNDELVLELGEIK